MAHQMDQWLDNRWPRAAPQDLALRGETANTAERFEFGDQLRVVELGQIGKHGRRIAFGPKPRDIADVLARVAELAVEPTADVQIAEPVGIDIGGARDC